MLATVGQRVRDVVGCEPSLGVADGLFCASSRRAKGVVVPVGATDTFRRAQPLVALGRKDLRPRAGGSGCTHSGAFADLAPGPGRRALLTHALPLHRVASGEVASCGPARPALPAPSDRCAARTRFVDEQTGSSASAARVTTGPRRPRTACAAASVPTPSWWRRFAEGAAPKIAPRWSLGSPPRTRREVAPWPGQFRGAVARDHPGSSGGAAVA